MLNKIKYDEKLIKHAKKIFPDWQDLHKYMQAGRTKPVLDMIHSKIGFFIDEDDIIRAFRNKNETKLLQLAERARDIRDFYQKVYIVLEKHETKILEKHGHEDCA